MTLSPLPVDNVVDTGRGMLWRILIYSFCCVRLFVDKPSVTICLHEQKHGVADLCHLNTWLALSDQMVEF